MNPVSFEEWTYAGNVKRLRFVVRRGRGYVRRKGLKKPRVYHKKGELLTWEPAYYFTIYIENWKGSGIEAQRGQWTFTVHASLATENKINEETYSEIIASVGEIASWVRDELGLHNAADPTTIGSTTDEQRKRSDFSEAAGWIRWSIEDQLVGEVFAGLRQGEFWSFDEVFKQIKRRTKLDCVGGAISARVAR